MLMKDWKFYRKAVVECLKAMYEKKAGSRVKIEPYGEDYDDIPKPDERCITIDSTAIVISRGVWEEEVESITGKEKQSVDGWIIERLISYPATYYEPENADVVIAAKCRSFSEVLSWIMEDIIKFRVDEFSYYYSYTEDKYFLDR